MVFDFLRNKNLSGLKHCLAAVLVSIENFSISNNITIQNILIKCIILGFRKSVSKTKISITTHNQKTWTAVTRQTHVIGTVYIDVENIPKKWRGWSSGHTLMRLF